MLYYEGFEDLFSFRNQTSLKIPQSILQGAFQLAIDIVIVGASGQYYENPVTYPKSTFWGTCLLVFEDCLSQKIDIYQPRTRIYEGRVGEAFEQWNRFRTFDPIYEYFVQLLIKAGTDPQEIPKYWYAEPEFIQLPIREVFFQPVGNIQLELLISWISPKPFTTPDGILHSGKNGGRNPNKPNGLPPNGIQPSKPLDPNFPFGGLPDPTPNSNLAAKGYENNDSGNIENNRDPLNNRDYSTTLYWALVKTRNKRPQYGTGCQTRVDFDYVQLIDSTVRADMAPFGPNSNPQGNGCGGTTIGYGLQLTGGSRIFFAFSDSAPEISYGSGTSIPASFQSIE